VLVGVWSAFRAGRGPRRDRPEAARPASAGGCIRQSAARQAPQLEQVRGSLGHVRSGWVLLGARRGPLGCATAGLGQCSYLSVVDATMGFEADTSADRGSPMVEHVARPSRQQRLYLALLTFLWVVIMRLCGLGEVGRGRRG